MSASPIYNLKIADIIIIAPEQSAFYFQALDLFVFVCTLVCMRRQEKNNEKIYICPSKSMYLFIYLFISLSIYLFMYLFVLWVCVYRVLAIIL